MLHIYNTSTSKKEPFKPIDPSCVKIYVCGLTTYDYCHIGNARSAFVVFDVVVRYLKEKGYKVKYVRNITDIDDKIILRARENKEDYKDLTKRFIDYMHEDEKAALATVFAQFAIIEERLLISNVSKFLDFSSRDLKV